MNVLGGKPALPIIVIPDANELAEVEVKPVAPPLANAQAVRIQPTANERPVRMQRVVAPVLGADRAVNNRMVNDRAEGPNYDTLTEAQKDSVFWETVASFQRNGNLDPGTVRAKLAGLSKTYYRIFGEKYKAYYDVLMLTLTADGMFERNRIAEYDQPKVISHAIALGKEQYHTLSTDMEFYQVIVEIGEYQSLDALLPADLK